MTKENTGEEFILKKQMKKEIISLKTKSKMN